MSKRKQSDDEKPIKKQKVQSESGESSDTSIITKQTEKENVPWKTSDILELIGRIEENIPKDDSVSYTRRLEKIDWGKISVKNRTVKECQKAWSDLLKQVRKFRLLKEIIEDMKDCVQKAKINPAKDTNRHPDKPKQSRNSYMFFVEEKRQEVMNEYPTLSPNDVFKKLGEMFRNLTPEERKKYDKQATIAKQEYVEQLQHFYNQYPELIPNKSRKSVEANKDAPEKPKTPYQLFTQIEKEKEEGDISKQVLIQRCRERWNKLSGKDKLFWINWSEEQHDKYMDDLKKYIKIHPEYEPPKIGSILTKEEKRIKARCLGKPEKPPSSAYNLFTKMLMENEEIRKIHPKEAINYVSEKWKACSDEEKNEYKIRVEQIREEYKVKLQTYLMGVPSEERDRIEEEENTKRKWVKSTSDKEGKMKKPEPPPLTHYKYFLSVYTGKENPSVVWNNMSEDEKKIYEEKLKAKKRNYIILYEQYLKSLSQEELENIGQSSADRYDTSSESESEDAQD